MDIVFFGSGSFGLPTLQALAREHAIRAVVSQPDRPAGRGTKLTPTPIAEWAAKNLSGATLLRPENVNESAILDQVRQFPADAWVVIAFGQKLSQSLLRDRFAINLHASLLPRWRGAAPINWAILAGDAQTGNSVITLAEKMDAGLILAQHPQKVDPLVTAGELHDQLSAAGPGLVLRVLDDHARGSLSPTQQDPGAVTLARKLKKADGFIDFKSGAEECRRKVHGLAPWPGVVVAFRDQPLRVLRVRVHERPAQTQQASEIGHVIDPDKGLIACGLGSTLELLEVQPQGKKPMKWSDFARGARITVGERLVDGPSALGGES